MSPHRAILALALSFAPLMARAELPAVTLHYLERPPYSQTRPDGAAQGLLIEPLLRALQRAALPYRLTSTPTLRQLRLIEDGQGLDCGLGWFRNPVRETKGQFSAMLYRDQPLGLIARSSLGWPDSISMREAVMRPDARLLVKQGFSYGELFDGLMAQRPRPAESSAAEVSTLMRMLQADRADWMPVAPEEGQWLLAQPSDAPQPAGAFRLLRFADAPPGSARHLYCNKAVPPEWLQRFDEALK